MNPKKLAAFAKAGSPPMPFPKKGDKGGSGDKGKGGGGGDHHPEPDDDDEGGPPDGDADDKGESDEDVAERVGNQVQSGDVDDQLDRLMNDYDADLDDGNAPPWAPQHDIWDRAKNAVDPDGDGDGRWDDPWLVVAHVYTALGGAIAQDGDEHGDDKGDHGGGGDGGDQGGGDEGGGQ